VGRAGGGRPAGRRAAVEITGAETKESHMLYYSLVFLVVALIAGLLGFGGVAGAASSIAQVLFGLFLIIFLVSLVMGIFARGRPPV